MDRTVEMLMAAERALVQNRCMIIPSVYVRPDVDKSTAAKVKEAVRLIQGRAYSSSIGSTGG